MRIAFVAEIWLPYTNGVVTRLSETVAELLRAGHEILIVAPDHPDGEMNPWGEGVTVRTVPVFRVGFIYGGQPWGLPLPRVRRHLREFRPDLVHVVSPLVLGAAGVWAARSLRLPLVASYHTDIAAYAGFYHVSFLRPVIWHTLRALHGRAQLNLVTSRYSEEVLGSHGVGRIRLWRRGVDLERFAPEAGPGSGRAPDALPIALYVGRMAHEKGLARLEPLARSGRFRLMMVGEGPDLKGLRERFAGTPTEFTGTLLGEDLAKAYTQADVLVFPSTTETLGLVVIEALASGIPVVSADTPASRELLADVPVGRRFPAGRPEDLPGIIGELLSSAPRTEIARQARESAEAWGWAAATAELVGYYERLLADPRVYAAPEGHGASGPF